jgi:2-polyprenyl-3-methyl-5-hydroxy-6-metoxy-1,4-benzoquinol methylase
MNPSVSSVLRRRAKSALKAVVPSDVRRYLRETVARARVRRLHSVSELDAELARVEREFAVSEDAGRRALASFCLVPPRDLPSDPYSVEYRDAQFALYRQISGRGSYDVQNELSPFDLPQALRSPFPYQTGSPAVVGEQLIAQGFIFRSMPLPPPGHVLEFGPGWGNTTLNFLQLGYRVTAVEIDPKFVELVRARCAQFSEHLTVVQGDMLSFRSRQPFDAVVFFESFHHCADHVQLLRNVREMLRPGGVLVLASEPVMKLPYPWGVRLDGMSLWSMRRYGWLELGFDNGYFLELLRREGWEVERRSEPALGQIADVILARRS